MRLQRMILNETCWFGPGAVSQIVQEVSQRNLKKAQLGHHAMQAAAPAYYVNSHTGCRSLLAPQCHEITRPADKV
ncbi:MAG TPA: hypothetical protein DEF05_12180 [Erwinia sp.]|uniref:hypothetical protein n=1 Tax=Erwinia citreus TaxID=558 RepID=UPI000E9EE973|nr:hypothetical protein [Erwinia sp.]HBV40412.1 hypothetical protein [Erwinia sp.]